MTQPNRVQMRRGVKLPPSTKYVGRPSRWGNPFRIGAQARFVESGVTLEIDRDTAVAFFRFWARQQLARDPAWLEPLRGFDLACYCPPADACHVDVLLQMLGHDDERVLDDAWAAAAAATPDGYFSAAVEGRWPNRWRAWYRSIDGSRTIDAFGRTQAAAIQALVAVVDDAELGR